MKKYERKTKRRAIKLIAFISATTFGLAGVLPAAAANSDCISTPSLDKAHQVTDLALGQGVKAQSWQWQPGSDAQNASVSSLGAKVSVVTGNLRYITFGVLHQGIPRSQDLRVLSNSNPNSLGSLNGDYFDSSGPWSAMIQDSQVLYSPPGQSGVVGLIRKKIVESKGYRSTGTLTIGTRKFNISGVNQPNSGSTSLVVYRANYINPLTPKGQTTLVIKAGKVYKVYPKGAAVSSKSGTVIQVKGYLAPIIAKLKAKSVVKISLPAVPAFEESMAADNVSTAGSISSKSNTLIFDSVNYTNLSTSGSTLFDSNFNDVTRAGRVTLRITPDITGNLFIRNVYRSGTQIRVDSGGYILQAKSSAAAATALKFKVGDAITLSRSYQAEAKNQFVTAAGRGPRMVQGGKLIWICALHNKEHRPRSAIGWNQDGQVWLMTSSRGYDAYDFGYRQGGSTSSQMAMWLMSLGATDAVLLDGGGSTTMQINKPDIGWQRFDLPDGAWWRELANAFSIDKKN
jgi:hypothetical protein